MKKSEITLKKSIIINPLIAFYFFVSFIEMIAEYNKDSYFISYTKPLTIPILILIYGFSVKSKNRSYIISLLLVWVASILLVSDKSYLIIIGSAFYLLSQLIIISLVLMRIKNPGISPILIGSLPFVFLYLFIGFYFYEKIELSLLLLIIQGVFMTFFSGLCFTNYLRKVNTTSSYLLVCSILFTLSQVLILTNGLGSKNAKLQVLTTVFFIGGQFIFYLYLISHDKKLKRYKVNN